MTKGILLPNGDIVNPEHVTSVVLDEGRTGPNSRTNTLIWVRGNSGYGTFSIKFKGDRGEELGKLIFGQLWSRSSEGGS